jgi:hypothetical protein
MPTPAGVLVDEARDYHASFDPRTVPAKASLRALSRIQRRIAEKVTEINEEALAQPVSLSKADVDAAALSGVAGPGISLPEHLLLLSAYTTRSGDPSFQIPVSLVTYANAPQHGALDFPSVYLIGQKLYPINGSQVGFTMGGDGTGPHGWEDLNGLTLLMVLTPAALVDLDSVISLPDAAHPAMVSLLALWMMQRQGVNISDLRGEAMDAERSALATLSGQGSTSTWSVVRV